MIVKADSKGRLTGAQPETKYLRREAADGTITYVPEVPKEFDTDRGVSWEEFESFFGVPPSQVAQDGITAVSLLTPREGFLNNGILVRAFVTAADGSRLASGGEVQAKDLLIRIKEEDK